LRVNLEVRSSNFNSLSITIVKIKKHTNDKGKTKKIQRRNNAAKKEYPGDRMDFMNSTEVDNPEDDFEGDVSGITSNKKVELNIEMNEFQQFRAT
jgi:hypothetical protein